MWVAMLEHHSHSCALPLYLLEIGIVDGKWKFLEHIEELLSVDDY